MKQQFDGAQPPRFVRYIRSSGSPAIASSQELQLAAIDDFVDQHCPGCEHVGDYIDDGCSGEQPSLQRMQADIISGRIQIDFILVESFRRLARRAEMADIVIRLYDQFDVRIVSVSVD